MKSLLSLLGLLLYSLAAFSQKEGNIWYFGEKAGIDFNYGVPVSLTDGAMITNEGCATISDKNGKLLFYTDGVSVWDRTHKKMPNGTGLAGNSSSTQSGIIVPKPLNPDIYYVFTVDAEAGSKGLEYSVVDMTKNGGNGDVIQKNSMLRTPVCEKLTAVQHANKKDFWVIAHDWNSRDFVLYLVTENGISASPKIIIGGQGYDGDVTNSIGYLKVSPGGNFIASAVKSGGGTGFGMVEIFKFDNSSGTLEHIMSIGNNANYGLEFSPDNTKLYTTVYDKHQILQYNLTVDKWQIAGTQVIIDTDPVAISALQLGPDRKIYVSRTGTKKLGVIRNPNESGTACNYEREGFTLKSGLCRSGLPTFVQSFFDPVSGFKHGAACKGQPVQFEGRTNVEPTGWLWNFGDPSSGAANFSSDKNPTHTYYLTGKYTVRLVIKVEGVNDTVTETIDVAESPKVNLGKDLVRCKAETVKLDAQNPGMKYTWSTGDSTRTIIADSSGIYWVRVSNGECSATDTVNVLLIDTAGVTLGEDVLACKGDTVTLKSNVPQARHFWSTGDTTASVKVTKSEKVIGMIIIGSCLIQDTVNVTFIDPPHVDLGPTRTICEGDSTELDAGNPGAEFLWSTGAATQKIRVYKGDTYWVFVRAGDCSSADTLKLLHCKANAYLPNVFTPNGDKLNDRFRVYGTDIAKGTLTITNRWGEKIWQSEDIFTGWDGSFKGRKCPDGVYLWSLLYWEYEGEILYPREIRGTMSLVRQ
jgi:gliding motility-associated-like protein